MLLTDRFDAQFALPIEPCVPVPGVHLQDRLEFSAATIDATLHEGHRNSPLLRCGRVFLAQACWTVPECGSFHGFLASFAAFGAEEAFARDGGFRTHLFSTPGKVLR